MEDKKDTTPAEKPTEEKAEPVKEKVISPVDAKKATQITTGYLEGIYGNLNMLLFRLEDVRMNGAANRYLVLCSLLTNVGGPRTYYFVKVDVSSGGVLKVAKGLRNMETREIEWKKENLPTGFEE